MTSRWVGAAGGQMGICDWRDDCVREKGRDSVERGIKTRIKAWK